MRNTLLTLLLAITLTACSSVPISDADRGLIKQGKKSLLATNNRDPADYLYVLPIFFDAMSGNEITVHIEEIDGKELDTSLFSVNEEIALDAGAHTITAECKVELDDTIRDVDDTSGNDYQATVDTISYTFEGGREYRIYGVEHFGGHCTLHIKATK